MNVTYSPPPLDENDDLFQALKEVTEEKAELFNSTSGKPDPPLKQFQEDFSPPAEPDHEPEPEPAPSMNYKEQARLMIAFVDGFQTLALPIAYQTSFFSSLEQEQLKAIKHLRATGTPENVIRADNGELLDKYEDCENLIEDLPFTEKEIKLVENPLAAVMEKYKFSPGPETLLMGAIFTIMAPRLAPLLINLKS